MAYQLSIEYTYLYLASYVGGTGGSVIIDLDAHDTHGLARWAPNIAAIRQGWQGNQQPYHEVDETLVVNVKDTTGQDVTVSLWQLSRVFEHLHAWWTGDRSFGPPLLKIKATSISETLSCMLVPSPDMGLLSTDQFLQEVNSISQVWDATVRLRRRGQWLAPEETAQSAAAVAMGVVQYAELPLAPTWPPGSADPHVGHGLNPLSLHFTGQAYDSASSASRVASFGAAFLIYSSLTHRIEVTSAAAVTAAAGVWSHETTGDNSSTSGRFGSAVLRYTPAGTGVVSTTAWTLATPDSKRSAVWVTLANRTAGKSYLVRAVLTGGGRTAYTRWTVIDYTTGQPQTVALGAASLDYTITKVALEIQATSTGGTLDIDAIAAAGQEHRGEGSLYYGAFTTLADVPFAAGDGMTLRVDNGALTSREPWVGVADGFNVKRGAFDYRGNAALLTTGETVAVLWFGTHGAKWRQMQSDTTTLTTLRLTARRHRAYTVPV